MRKVQCEGSVYVMQEYKPQFDVEFPIVPASRKELKESAEWWADYMDAHIDQKPVHNDPELEYDLAE